MSFNVACRLMKDPEWFLKQTKHTGAHKLKENLEQFEHWQPCWGLTQIYCCVLGRNFISIYKTNRTLHGRLGIRILSSRAESIFLE